MEGPALSLCVSHTYSLAWRCNDIATGMTCFASLNWTKVEINCGIWRAYSFHYGLRLHSQYLVMRELNILLAYILRALLK